MSDILQNGDTPWLLRRAINRLYQLVLGNTNNIARLQSQAAQPVFPATGFVMTCTNSPYRQYRVTVEDTAGIGNAVFTITPL